MCSHVVISFSYSSRYFLIPHNKDLSSPKCHVLRLRNPLSLLLYTQSSSSFSRISTPYVGGCTFGSFPEPWDISFWRFVQFYVCFWWRGLTVLSHCHSRKFDHTFIFNPTCPCIWASLVAQLVKNPHELRETWVWPMGWEDLENGTASQHSSVLAWGIGLYSPHI